MAVVADVGTGSTLTFGTTSYTTQILSVSYSGAEVAVVDTSHFGTTGHRDYIFGDLKEGGELSVSINYGPDEPVPLGTQETVTLTFPIPTGGSSGATMVFSGGIRSSGFDVPLEDKMTGTFVVKVMGDITFTDHA